MLLVLQKEVFLTLGCKILAKLIHNTENLYNFVFGNHRLIYCCNILYFSTIKIQHICEITNFYKNFLIPNSRNNYNVLMIEVENVGYDATGKKIDGSELPEVSAKIKELISSLV